MWDQSSFSWGLRCPTGQLCLSGQDWCYCCLPRRCSSLLVWRIRKRSLCSTVCQLDEVHHQKCAPGEPRTGTKHNRGSLGFCTARWRHSGAKQCRAAASRKAHFGANITLLGGMHNPHLVMRLIWEDDLLRYHRHLRLRAQISCVFHVVSLHVFSWVSPTLTPRYFLQHVGTGTRSWANTAAPAWEKGTVLCFAEEYNTLKNLIQLVLMQKWGLLSLHITADNTG